MNYSLTGGTILRAAAAALLFGTALGQLFPAALPAPLVLPGQALSLLNTIFHEVGHMVFGMLGSALGVAGGSIGQLVPPLLLLGSAIRQQAPIAAAAAVFWVGQNLLDMAAYIADAQGLKLAYFQWWAAFGGPFLEQGDPAHHDWHIMLSSIGLLWADWLLAWAAAGIGVLLMIGSAAILIRADSGLLLGSVYKKRNLD